MEKTYFLVTFFLWHQFDVVKWFPSLQHVILFVWRAETSLHHSPAVTALCSHSQYFIFVCLLSCFLLLPSSTFWPIVPLWLHSPFCCLLSPVLMCTSCHLFLFPPLLPRLPLLSLFPLLSLHCCSSSTTFCRLSSSSSSSPPWWLRVNSWRCCSIASVCPACRANPTPHQALGPSTPTKYFYLFIHPRPSGASWR